MKEVHHPSHTRYIHLYTIMFRMGTESSKQNRNKTSHFISLLCYNNACISHTKTVTYAAKKVNDYIMITIAATQSHQQHNTVKPKQYQLRIKVLDFLIFPSYNSIFDMYLPLACRKKLCQTKGQTPARLSAKIFIIKLQQHKYKQGTGFIIHCRMSYISGNIIITVSSCLHLT